MRVPLTATATRTHSNRIVALRKATACRLFRMGKRPPSCGGKRVGGGSTLSYKERRTGSVIAGSPPLSRAQGQAEGGMETAMSRQMLTGSFVALITPFNKDGSVDFGAFQALLRFQEQHGTSAVLIMGSTGETSMLSPEEKKQITVETAKMKTPRMPIFFGCTGNNTESTIANVRFAKANGADGAILAAPAYICAPESDIERFFLDVADATDLPLGIYNNPPRVKSDLHWEHLLRIFQHPNY